MSASLTVVSPGMLTTVQDLGRWGLQSSGVPVAGPMDAYSHRLANGLVGNRADAAALEVTLLGPELVASGNVLCAVAGAGFSVTVNDEAADTRVSFDVADGGRIRFGSRSIGARATLAVRGGFDLPAVFGSRATSLTARMGPFGRALVRGDRLPVGEATGTPARAGSPLQLTSGGCRLRVIMGPHEGMFTSRAVETLLRSRFVVSPQSNRMGYRLSGESLERRDLNELLSEATPMGSLQVTSSGQPILLMADRQTTGGYPKIATVISADLPHAGQLAPGDWIEFAQCTRAEAIDALRQQESALAGAAR